MAQRKYNCAADDASFPKVPAAMTQKKVKPFDAVANLQMSSQGTFFMQIKDYV